ncbi:hypothetical protein HN51_040187 [Arachis hypogaea]|uniref:Uncharacterized protein n=4 Tax=Arachis hypogaea TaxID=3818 RepID=A0A444YMN5_ARAHY|nr:protein SLOW GREEN 1, chloroplastic [Arachis ipaensis]XP_025663517.1 protein SLOW GREEN 1, chloroplastic [Arachis hypogaea]QHN85882.1 protein SLOW GREEN 1 [Arachis hypogaea]RYR03205.1 hypothetical protein Ahy_B06g082057 isoform A [Arachis hypogaea]
MFPLATPTVVSPTRAPMASLRHLSLNPHRSSSLSPFSLSFPPSSSTTFKFSSIRASSQNHPKPQNDDLLSRFLKTLINPILSPAFETTCIVIFATAFFFMRLRHNPVIAAPLTSPSATAETYTSADPDAPNEEKEKEIEEHLSTNASDIEALRTLMELKIRARKIDEAIGIIDRLIELEPQESEWPLLKAHMHVYNDQVDLARNVFEEILQRDPLRVEAYHGLAMTAFESKLPLNDLLKRIEAAMEQCKKQNRNSEVRDFKLLIAQIKVMEGDLDAALKAYQDLVKEEPRDFRPYLCQGIIYTLLKKKDEAEKQFNKFRRLVPKNHPYKEYFEDNMSATKFFSQKVEREGAAARS